MRTLYFFLFLLTFTVLGNAQPNYPQWLNFSTVHILNNITIENNSTIWASTYGAGIVRYETVNGYKKVYNGANSIIHRNNIHNIVIDNNQIKWISGLGGLFQCDLNNNWIEINTLPNGDTLSGVFHITRNSLGAIAFLYSDEFYSVKVGVYDSTGFSFFIVPAAQSLQLMRALAIDNNGKIWVGNNNKISYYNGNTWITYDDSTIPNMGYISKITTDASNDMYVAMGTTNGNQALYYKFDGISWNLFFTYPSGFSTTFMVIDSNNHLLFGGPFPGIKEYNGNTIVTHNSNLPLSNKNIGCFYLDQNHNWWLTYTEEPETIYGFDNGTWKVNNIKTSGVGSYYLTGVTKDLAGKIWIQGTGPKSITMFDGFNFNAYDSITSPISYTNSLSLSTDNNGNVSFFTNNSGTGGPSLVKYVNGNWIFIPVPFVSSAYVLQKMVYDNNGNLWIASQEGVLKFDGINWSIYNSNNSGLPYNGVYDIKVDSSDNLWLAVAGTGLVKYEQTSNTWTLYDNTNSGLPVNSILYLFMDNSGKLWIPSSAGLTTFDGSNWYTYTGSSIPSGTPVAQDNNGVIWFGGFNGLSSFDGTNWTNYSFYNSGVTAGVFTIYIDNFNTKWCATVQGGLVLFNENGISPHNFHYLSSSTIMGEVFYDVNNNSLKDTSDVPLAMQKILLEPDSIFTFSNSNGNYFFHRVPGNYQSTYIGHPDWHLTTDSASYTIALDTLDLNGYDFGCYPNIIYEQLEINITGLSSRCHMPSNVYIDYYNNGTTIANGFIAFLPDDSLTINYSIPPYNFMSGDTLFWNYNNLLPFEHQQILLNVIIPGLQFNDTLISYTQLISNGLLVSSDNLLQVITCSWDPNDKLVEPEGSGLTNLTYILDTLTYTIRFQNLGNDTAFIVYIVDTLHSALNLNSLEIVGSSHTCNVSYTANGIITFEFPDIVLPHAETDYAASMGYVKFKISPNVGINDPTVVTNRAFIYFDYNPAVETNTVMNTLTANLVNTTEISNNVKFNIYPNPSNGNFNIIYMLPKQKEEKLEIIDITGKIIYKLSLSQSSSLQQISLPLRISNGIYYCIITSENYKVSKKIVIIK